MRRPGADALVAAKDLASRNRGRTAQLRRSFIVRPDTNTPSPLAQLLRGGRGGQVRLKAYLSMMWLAAAPPHDVAYPSRAWATLLDLPDAAGLGARRINDAVAWLEENRFVRVEARPGHPNRVTLLEESGSGAPYSVPGEAASALKAKGKTRVGDPQVEQHRYVQIPPQFWTSGWMAALSGPGLAMYLVLLAEKGPDESGRDLWFSPRIAAERYGLSSDTRTAGLDELRRAGLITVRRQPVSTNVFDVVRFRNVYTLQPDRLSESAEIPDREDKATRRTTGSVPTKKTLRRVPSHGRHSGSATDDSPTTGIRRRTR